MTIKIKLSIGDSLKSEADLATSFNTAVFNLQEQMNKKLNQRSAEELAKLSRAFFKQNLNKFDTMADTMLKENMDARNQLVHNTKKISLHNVAVEQSSRISKNGLSIRMNFIPLPYILQYSENPDRELSDDYDDLIDWIEERGLKYVRKYRQRHGKLVPQNSYRLASPQEVLMAILNGKRKSDRDSRSSKYTLDPPSKTGANFYRYGEASALTTLKETLDIMQEVVFNEYVSFANDYFANVSTASSSKRHARRRKI